MEVRKVLNSKYLLDYYFKPEMEVRAKDIRIGSVAVGVKFLRMSRLTNGWSANDIDEEKAHYIKYAEIA